MSALTRKAVSTFAAAAVPAGIAAAFVSVAPAVRAARTIGTYPVPRRLRAYYWARSQTGHPYVWGGTGPGYDCSGLVMMAYRHAGVRLPRTTSGMLASSLL